MNNIISIIERFKQFSGTETDSSVAELLGVSQSALAERKRKGSVPYEEFIVFAERSGISLDWLILGKGATWREPIKQIKSTTKDLRGEREFSIPLYPDWPNRLKSQMHVKKTSAEMLSTDLGIKIDKIDGFIQGAITPTYEELLKLSAALGVAERWLAAGYHDMKLPMAQSDIRKVPDINEDYVSIRKVTGEIAANGNPVADNTIEMRLLFRRDWVSRIGDPAELSLMRVKGDSMEPTILSGDLVLIDNSKTAIDPQGGIYTLVWNNDVMIKRVQVVNPQGQIKIISDNPSYETISANTDQVTINGKVIWYGRMLVR